ncbi:MAG: hypothetical protein LUE17_03185 [Planctomycetaceae bacterium]|nr:hypothetical protein [Planctomycetaceae bacterium]
MSEKITKKSLLVLLWLCIGVAVSGHAGTTRSTIDLDDGPLTSGSTYTYPSRTFVSGGESSEYSRGEYIKVSGTTTFGGSGSGYTLNLQRIETVGDATISINSAGTAGVNVYAGQLTPAGNQTLTVNLGAGSGQDARNRFSIDSLEQNGSMKINVSNYSTFAIYGPAILGTIGGSGGTTFTLDMKGRTAEASLASGTVLANGTIGGMGYLAVGNGLTIASADDGGSGSASLVVNGDLNVVTALGSTTRGTLFLGGTSLPTHLSITNNGTLSAGEIYIDENVVMTAGSRGVIDAEALFITADFTEARDVDTRVSGLTSVDEGVVYTVSGTGDIFAGGMDLYGTLTNSGATTVTFGTANTLSSLNVVDGSIAAAAGGLKIDYADIFITSEDIVPFTSLDASAAALNLGTSDVTVSLDGNATTFAADRGITIGNYRQLLGDVSLTGTGGSMTVTGSAAIGSQSAGARVFLHLEAGTTANFNKGLVLDRYGSLNAVGNATVNLGSAGANGDLNLVGDNALVGDTGQLTINSNGSTRKFTVSGHNNIAHGNINAAGFDLTVTAGDILSVAGTGTPGLTVRSASVAGRLDLGTDAFTDVSGNEKGAYLTLNGDMAVSSGGIVAANYGTAHIATTGGRFTVDQGGSLIAETGTIEARGFSGIAINGSFTAGWTDTGGSGNVARLDTDSSVTIGSTGRVSVTTELAKNAALNQVLINAAGAITNNGNWDYMSMYGKMRFGMAAGDTQLLITDLSNQLSGTDEEKRRQALANLREMWGENQI